MPNKFDLAVITAAWAAGLLFIEAGHRTVLEPPSGSAAMAATPCAEFDMRYAASRLVFLEGGFMSGVNRRQIAAERASLPPGCAR